MLILDPGNFRKKTPMDSLFILFSLSRQSQRFQQSNLPTELNPENDDPNAGRTVSDSIEVPYSSRYVRLFTDLYFTFSPRIYIS